MSERDNAIAKTPASWKGKVPGTLLSPGFTCTGVVTALQRQEDSPNYYADV